MTGTSNATISDTTGTATLLLQTEILAVATYTQAIPLFPHEVAILDLQRARDGHSRSIRLVMDWMIDSLGVSLDGTIDERMRGPGASLTGADPRVILSTLLETETQGIALCRAAIENSAAHPDYQRLIRNEVLLGCQRNVLIVNQLTAGLDRG